MKKIILLALSICSFDAYAKESIQDKIEENVDLSGNYECEGYDIFKKLDYHGKLNIKKEGQGYSLDYDFDDGKYEGTGVLDNNKDVCGVLFSMKNNNYIGVQVYNIYPDGTLSGNWTTANNYITSYETCRKIEEQKKMMQQQKAQEAEKAVREQQK